MKRPFRSLTRTLLSTILLKEGRSRQNNHTISLCFAKCCVSHVPGQISQKWLREALHRMERCMPDKRTLTWVVCRAGSLLLLFFNPVSLRLQEVTGGGTEAISSRCGPNSPAAGMGRTAGFSSEQDHSPKCGTSLLAQWGSHSLPHRSRRALGKRGCCAPISPWVLGAPNTWAHPSSAAKVTPLPWSPLSQTCDGKSDFRPC